VVHLHYLHLTVAETADALGIPPGTVKSRSYYAMQALRVALGSEGIDT
jgi:RNA polymerase sigma-70 factor (ECF subfamily)